MAAPGLKSAWAVALGGRVLSLGASADGAQIAAGTADAALLLDAASGRRGAERGDGRDGPVSAVAFTDAGLLLVGCRGALHLWDPASGAALASLELAPDGEPVRDDAVFIARQPGGPLFGVASAHGRRAFVVDQELRVQWELELQAKHGALTELSWLSSAALLATCSGGIQGWVPALGGGPPSLMLGRSIGLVSARASPDQATLAAGSRDGVVYLWSIVEGDSQAGDEALFADLRSTLKDYTDEVHLLRWDRSGRYLATADGSEVTIWDVPMLFEQPVQSNICCGHAADARITCAAFQSDGPLLATGGSDGKVLIYSSSDFAPGQVSQPCATAACPLPGDSVTCMAWLPGGQLVIGTESGSVAAWQLGAAQLGTAPEPAAAVQPQPQSQPPAPQPQPQQPPPQQQQLPQQQQRPAAAAASQHEPGMNGFARGRSLPPQRPQQQHPQLPQQQQQQQQQQQRAGGSGRPPLESAASMERMGSLQHQQQLQQQQQQQQRVARQQARVLARNNSSGSLGPERTASLPRSARELDRRELPGAASGEIGAGIAEVGRSVSLQEGSQARRAGSLERQQLSPSLMQHIQRVQQRPAASHRQREPAGWGMGSPAAAASAAWQVPFAAPNGVIPYGAAPGQAPGAMQPGYMMFPGQTAAAMGPQGLVPAYGFPGMAPVPMVPPGPQAAQQGAKSLPAMPQGMQAQLQAGMQPGMVYMPLGHAAAMQQAQWPLAVQGGWMQQFYVHPGHRAPAALDQMAVTAAGRSASAPDAPATPLAWPGARPSAPHGGQAGSHDLRESLAKNAISLPAGVSAEWRAQQAQAAAALAQGKEAAASSAPEPGQALKRRSASGIDVSKPPPAVAPLREARDSREGLDSPTDAAPARTRPPASPRNPRASMQHEPLPEHPEEAELATDPAAPVVTVYVGNLPPTVDEVALMLPFSYFGSITNIQVIRDKNSLQSRGFAFVSYAQPMFAASAIQNMNGRIMFGSFRGRALKVGPSNRVI